MKWVKLPKYCELSGDTANAVHARRKKRPVAGWRPLPGKKQQSLDQYRGS